MRGLNDSIQKAIFQFVDGRTFRKYSLKKPEIVTNVSDHIVSKVFNWKHKDGRIHASPSADEYYAITASIYHPQFRSQVEDGVWPIVNELTQKNYLTLSSCEGHDWTRLFVGVAFGSKEEAQSFALTLRNSIKAPTFFVREKETYSNQTISFSSGKLEVKKINHIEFQQEADYLNKLFLRNYVRYYFVEFGLFEFKRDHFFLNCYMHLMKAMFGKKAHEELLGFFKSGQLKLLIG